VRGRHLAQRWQETPSTTVALELVECPDRRLHRALIQLAARKAEDGETALTLLLPRRTYSPVVGRLLHRDTADGIAQALAHLRHVAVTVMPFDVQQAVREAKAREEARRQAETAARASS
jgi:hypothetical protein